MSQNDFFPFFNDFLTNSIISVFNYVYLTLLISLFKVFEVGIFFAISFIKKEQDTHSINRLFFFWKMLAKILISKLFGNKNAIKHEILGFLRFFEAFQRFFVFYKFFSSKNWGFLWNFSDFWVKLSGNTASFKDQD